MLFKVNAYQKLSITDSFYGFTSGEQRVLGKFRAKVFVDELFPTIDEKRFTVLYSDKALRSNTPINVLLVLSLLKKCLIIRMMR